jgi:hypothetical protein
VSILRTLRGVVKEEMMENRGVERDVVGKSAFSTVLAACWFRCISEAQTQWLAWSSYSNLKLVQHNVLDTREIGPHI